MPEITIYGTLIWFTSILIGSLALVVFLGSKNLSSRAFAHSILWVTIWIFCVGLFVSSRDYQSALFYSRLTYFLGSTIATAFLYFFITYPEDKKPSTLFTWSLVILQIIFCYLFLFTDKIIYSEFPISAAHPWGWRFGSLSFLFELVFFGFFAYGVAILYRKYKYYSDKNTKGNLKYMLLTIIVGATPPSLMCIVLPRFGYFGLNWLGPVTEIVWIPFIAYSIIKYRQMNVRAVATEVLAIGMTVIFFVNIFIDLSWGIAGRAATFIVFIALATYLLKISLREAEQRAKLSDLNKNLEQKVADQTAEVKHAYEMEKKARKDLERLNETKDQFIMITQHHLRTPITGIRWEIESLLKGERGEIDGEARQALMEASGSVDRLTHIVDDFLDITAIKAGTNILNTSVGSLMPAVREVIDELHLDIERSGIAVSYPMNADAWPEFPVDYDKMRECLFIVVENAVKYNRRNGSVSITTGKRGGLFEIAIENTGIGISPEERGKIGTSLFFRGHQARELNPIGMGIGLSVVKAIVKAHRGEFKIESKGKDLGARAVIWLPMG
ncbi:HAMP domain-containing histidine kinase [Patescibacteria group bacterium]|nr:HAMP domain-containing histidine kinase [Patescibacteria group bacterium]MDE1946763.1 hypothetical protein [Patescibacteria group bacterium]MDE2010934.1 hypothetical protein [Patescibacteria group bacterium]MDE2233617.1 hypothetical protein [Patescibacteria group bacterium]